MVGSLTKSGVKESQIGILSLYHTQLNLLRYQLKAFKELELFTIDKCQGRDKDCIIVSFVRSNPSGNVGDLLKEWRRINVLLTRSKKKLVLVGSRSTLQRIPLLRDLFTLLSDKGWVGVSFS